MRREDNTTETATAACDAPHLTGGMPQHQPSRVMITSLSPMVDCGEFAVKRIQNESLVVTASIVGDGHDLLRAELLWRKSDPKNSHHQSAWQRLPCVAIGNDEYQCELSFAELGRYEFTIEASLDRFATWARNLYRKLKAGDRDVDADLQAGIAMLSLWHRYLNEAERQNLTSKLSILDHGLRSKPNLATFLAWLKDSDLAQMAAKIPDKASDTVWPNQIPIDIERPLAARSAWYEFFPRSTSPQQGRPGTFKDCHRFVAYAADLGFDVIYLPPIHPIGITERKGRNNTLTSTASDVGSPWAIGGEEGGFYDVHPELGSKADFVALIQAAKAHGCEIAMDIAFQCSPDHPYVKQNPQWFMQRPDGTIAYAENPPKKYQDIFPFNFENDDWQALWQELRDVVLHWVNLGVTVFRVDNPHTKPFRFWQWLITEVRGQYPSVIFLAEAFSRPHVMQQLAKIGFSQSYTYFTWREEKWEFVDYLKSLTASPLVDYMRPNFWPNTPDILPRHLQHRGEIAFKKRLVLAATLSANYGIYGPVFEQCVNRPLAEGKEDYLDSEKYEVKHWNLAKAGSIAPFIRKINLIRRENPALLNDRSMLFVDINNEQLLAFLKRQGTNCILVVVNLDENHIQRGIIDVPIHKLGISPESHYAVHDLLDDARYYWQGWKNFVELRPDITPAHIFRLDISEPVTPASTPWDDDSLPFRVE